MQAVAVLGFALVGDSGAIISAGSTDLYHCYNMQRSRSSPALFHLFALRYEWARE